MLSVGDLAPDFPVPTPEQPSRTLSSLRGHPVILFFFPKANTAGCTRETRGFAVRYPKFREAGVEVIGVSVDSGETQAAFAEKCGAQFPMVGDPTKEIARKYGVLGLLGIAKRVTFLLDAEGRVRQVVEGLLPDPHLRAAEGWGAPPPSPP